MNMNGIKLVLLFLQVLHIHCSVDELRSLRNCGWTPKLGTQQIINGHIVQPQEYSWMASLEYRDRGYGYCAGSVISSLYVLTAAHCVTGQQVQKYGGLTGVRLGNFTQEPFCDYGNPQCSYLHFGIANIKVHENYGPDSNQTIRNDIALLRLDKPIIFGRHIKRVCLPFNTAEPAVNTQLTVAGWGRTTTSTDLMAKRAVGVPLVEKSQCEYQDDSLMCAAKLGNIIESRTTCYGDSGGPLMHEFRLRHMVIEGIVSFVPGQCANQFSPTHYTRVRHYLSWIEENMCTGTDCTTVAEWKFPKDCGSTPMYPREENTNGEGLIRPDEYSWVAALVYENKLSFVGSVINSRYVLTAADSVSRKVTRQIGALIGVRLGDFDDSGHMCDYGLANCTHYQEFGIEKIIMHRGYTNTGYKITNNIALIRLDRLIQFGPKRKPICLPFGIYDKPEPPVDSSLTIAGWIKQVDNSLAKSDAIVTRIYNCTALLQEVCSSNSCIGGIGSPLMFYQFARRRMVLEGIFSESIHCMGKRYPTVHTRVRSYRDWLNENMEM